MTRALDLRLTVPLAFLAAVALAMCEFPAHGATRYRSACDAMDGDTLRCGAITVRLSAIDAPELPGHCRKGRTCAPGDPYASRDNLARLVKGRTVYFVKLELDRYGRIVALPTAGHVNLACAQLRGGFAIYWRKYDHFQRLAKRCRAAAS